MSALGDLRRELWRIRGSLDWPWGDSFVRAVAEAQAEMGAVLRHPEWDAETVAAYWYFWPMSEAW